MSTEYKFRRGTTAKHNTFAGAEAELTIDTSKKTAVVHDGSTIGGFPLAREDHVHSYNDLTNKPVLFSGNYADLAGKPEIFSGDYADLAGKPVLSPVATTGDYADLSNKPVLFSGSYADLTGKPALFSGNYADLTGKPALFSGSYTDLADKPVLFDGAYSSLSGIPSTFAPEAHGHTIAEVTGLQAAIDGKADSSAVYTKAETDSKISALVDSAPEVLNTLSELATALGNDANFATTVSNQIGLKANSADLSAVATSGAYADLTGKPTLGTASAQDVGYFATSGHTHTISNVTGLQDALSSKAASLDLSNLIAFTGGAYGSSTMPGYWGGLNYINTATSLRNAIELLDGAMVSKVNTYQLSTVATSGSYDDLTNKPVMFSGSYTDLTNKPSFAPVATSGAYADLTGKPTLFSGSYTDLTNKPVLFSGSYNDLSNKPVLAPVATSGKYSDLTSKPVLFSGSYDDLTNKPDLNATLQASLMEPSVFGVTFNFKTMDFGSEAGPFLQFSTWADAGGSFIDDSGIGVTGLPSALYDMANRIRNLEQNSGVSTGDVSVRETINDPGNGGMTLSIFAFNTFYHVMDQASEQLWVSAGTVGVDDNAVQSTEVVHFTVRVKMSDNDIPNREMTFGGADWHPVGPAAFNYTPGAENVVKATYWGNTGDVTYTILAS